MLGTTAISWLGQVFPLIGQWGALLIALLFIYVPIEVLERRGVSLRTMGIWRGRLSHEIRQFLFISLLVFPAYAVCFHYFQTTVEKRDAKFEVRRLMDWPLEHAPNSNTDRKPDGIRVILKGDQVYLRWHLPEQEDVNIEINGDKILQLKRGNVESTKVGTALSLKAPSSGSAVLITRSTTIRISAHVNGVPISASQMLDGYDQPLNENPINVDRSWWWFLHFLLGQLLLVALPEEIFYRGYLQSRLEQKFPNQHRVFGVMISWPALLWTSAIFAVGHILTVPHPARLAVFFPSLLFGWMRSATGSVSSAILFHAACNLFAQIAFKFYV